MRIAHSGRAKIRLRHPSAMGECDLCGFWVSLDDLAPQFTWAGNSLVDTGQLRCDGCLDKPQDQYRSPILPPDPIPRISPRPSASVTPIPYIGSPLPTTPENQGFTQYVLGPSSLVFGMPSPSAVLAAVAANSHVPTPNPASLISNIVPMAGNTTVPLLAANANRTFLLIFNPTQFPAQISRVAAVNGAISNLSIGPNEAYFQATALGLGGAYTGAMTAVGLFAPLPLWIWEDGGVETPPPPPPPPDEPPPPPPPPVPTNLANDNGVLYLSTAVAQFPTSPTGLSPGAIWNNGLTLSVIPGITPNPAAPPVIFGSISALALLALGGGDLPTAPPVLLNQLWNNGGLICVTLAGVSGASLDFSQASNSGYIALL